MHHTTTRLLVLAFAAAAATAQLTPITNSTIAHNDARIAPDASHVAFRDGTTALGIVDIDGAAPEVMLHTSATVALSSYVWAPDSTQLYFVDGNDVLRVAIAGGAATPVATGLPGSAIRLAAIDSTGQQLYGTRRDAATNQTMLFRLATAGGAPQDLVTRIGTIDQVGLDESDSYLLLRTWSGAVPFPATFERHDLVGNVTLPMITINQLTESAHWITAGTHFTCAMTSPAHPFVPQIARIANTGAIDWLVDEGVMALRPYFPGNSEEIVFETENPLIPGATSIGMVPNHGGAVIFVNEIMPLFLNGGGNEGGLTIDSATTKIAVGASTWVWAVPQIFVSDIDETLHVHPKLQIGSPFQIDLDIPQGEIGVVAVADGLTTGNTVTITGIAGAFWLDTTPGHMITALTGVAGPGGGLGGTWQIPFAPSLRGLKLWVQGAHADATLTGEFTRYGYYRVY